MLLQLFCSFFKIGAFTIGGGYAMLPLMEEEIVRRHSWLSEADFADVAALSQSMPGVLAVNMAVAVGYKLRGRRGAAVAVVGNILMPVVFILALAMFFRWFADNPVVESVFKGIRPAVVALIAAPVVRMARTVGVGWGNCWIPLSSFVAVAFLNVSPAVVIVVAVAATVVVALYRRRASER